MPRYTPMALTCAREIKIFVDSGRVFRALFPDLSKTFGCLDHELLIVKLNASGFSLPVLRLIHDYLSHRKQE